MAFWFFMLISDLIIPLMMIFFGRSYRKDPPAAINYYEGYRTKRSKKSAESWVYAHRYWGRLSQIVAAAALPLSVIPLLFVMGKDEGTVGTLGGAVCFVQIVVVLFVPIIATERALKRNFDNDGKPLEEK